MAHVVAGIDVGSFSVKCALIEAGFRHVRVVGVREQLVPEGPAPLGERQREALTALVQSLPEERTLYAALGGEQVALRVLELPFADPRKVEQVLGYELEAQIVHPLEEVTYDHTILTLPGPKTHVLAAVARLVDVGAILEAFKAAGAEPRALFAGPTIYRALPSLVPTVEKAVRRRTPSPKPGGAAALGDDEPTAITTLGPGALASLDPDCRLVVDFGHSRTNICLVSRGDALYGRTLVHGGAALTDVLARSLAVPHDRAEEVKRQHGLLPLVSDGPWGPGETQVAQILVGRLGPWLRELRQTLAGFRATSRATVTSVTLLGGGGCLPGLGLWLARELGVAEVPFESTSALGAVFDGDAMAGVDERFGLALAVAWAGVRGRRELDLRRGPFVYKASFSILRQRAWHLAALAILLLASVVVDATTTLGRLAREKAQLESELRRSTQTLFGSPRMDARQVTAELKKSFKDEMVTLPVMTGFDLLDEVSKKVPPREKVKLDIQQLDFRPRKAFIKGTVDSAAAVDEMVAKLKEIECFEEITKGSITEVSGGAKQFTLTIASKCP